MDRAAPAAAGETEAMRTESPGTSYLALPDGPAPYPGVVVIHEASGLNDNIRDICRRFAAEGYAALGVDLFEGRNRAACMARMFIGGMAGNLNYYGVPALKAALGRVAGHPEVDANRIGAIGFCLGGSIVLTWACTDGRLGAIAPFYGAAPKPREAIRRLCPVVGSWPRKDFTTKAAGVLEACVTAAGIPHDLKVYPGAKHSFFNDQWRNHHAAAAADSWQRVLAFFAEHVRQLGSRLVPQSKRVRVLAEGLTTAVEQSGSHPQLAAVRARIGRRADAREPETTLPNDAVGDRNVVTGHRAASARNPGVRCGQRSAVTGFRSPVDDRTSVLCRDPGSRYRPAGTTRPASAGGQADPSGVRVVLVRPGRRSASVFTIRSVSRRISALNGPTNTQ